MKERKIGPARTSTTERAHNNGILGRAKTAARVLGILLGLILVSSHQPTLAQTNACAVLVRETVVPVQECATADATCIAFPQCCVPGACFVNPECFFLKILKKTISAGDVYCDFSADEFVDQMLTRNIANLANLVGAGLPSEIIVALDAHSQLVAAKGKPFPEPAKNVLRDLITPYYDSGQTGYSYEDIADARIISSSDGDANLWFSFSPTAYAMTIGPVIVFRDDVYRQLSGTGSLESIQRGYATPEYAQAIETAVHELVHYAQFRRYGSDVFRTNYVLDYLAGGTEGYERNRYEREAYAFSAILSRSHGGWYCEDNRGHHEASINKHYLGIIYGACTPLYYGNLPVGQCALSASWFDGTVKKPSTVSDPCQVAPAPVGSTPRVFAPIYAIDPIKTRVNCRWVGVGKSWDPHRKRICDTALSCAMGVLSAHTCRLGSAPDGTRAGYNSNSRSFVYHEIPQATSIPPAPSGPPPMTCVRACKDERDYCQSHVGEPGEPRGIQCAQKYNQCMKSCSP